MSEIRTKYLNTRQILTTFYPKSGFRTRTVLFAGKTVKTSKKYKKDNGKLDLGDLLGRSKDGFQPLNTEDDDVVNISSDSDVEDFAVPALHT